MRRLTILTLFLALAACAQNRSSIEVDGRAAPSDATTCKFSAGGEHLLGPGVLDLAPSPIWPVPRYSTVLYVTNSLVDPATLNPGSGTSPASDTSAKVWTANAVRIRVNPRDYVGTYPPNPTLVTLTAERRYALDGQATEPSKSSTQYVEVIGPELAQLLAGFVTDTTPQRIVVGITLEGRTYDGASVDSGEWYFPIDLCYGCLATNLPTCAAGQVLRSTNCFGVGQDSGPVCGSAQ